MANFQLFSVALTILFVSYGSTKKLLLISFDGFRWDYLKMYPAETSVFSDLIQRGVYVEKMRPTFVTKTFPTHWSMVTGLYDESHGIVSNSMYDPLYDEHFHFGTTDEKWWNASLPIWITARKAGLKTGTYFWPGSEVEFNGLRPHYYFTYSNSVPYYKRIETVVNWFANDNVTFATLYFNEPDSTGHNHGPNSTNIGSKLAELNTHMGLLMWKLQLNGLLHEVDIIVSSDHGMAKISKEKLISFNNTLAPYIFAVKDRGPLLSMFAKPNMTNDLLIKVKNLTDTLKLPVNVYSREEVPKDLHYSKHRRIPDVLVIPNEGYIVDDGDNLSRSNLKGNHGWNNYFDDMAVPLFAFGPSFRKNAKVSGFRQVDIYGLMCKLLDITPQQNNGSSALHELILNNAANVHQTNGALFCSICAFLLSFMIAK